MKNKKIKACAFLIIFVLSVCLLAACAGDSEETANNSTGGGGNAQSNTSGSADGSDEQSADIRIMPDLPDTDYGGYAFRILVRDDQWAVWRAYDVYTESMDGIRAALIDAGNGRKIPLEEVADVVSVGGASSISRENVQRKIVVSANVSGKDLVGAVNDING